MEQIHDRVECAGGTKQMNKLRCLYVKYRQPVNVDKVVDKVRKKCK